MKLQDLKADLAHAVAVFPNARGDRGSPRSTLWNTRLSCLLILQGRYSQTCVSSRAAEPFRGRLLCTDSHYWYTSHIHPPTQQQLQAERHPHVRSQTFTAPRGSYKHRNVNLCLFQHTTSSLMCIRPKLCSDFSALFSLFGRENVRKINA